MRRLKRPFAAAALLAGLLSLFVAPSAGAAQQAGEPVTSLDGLVLRPAHPNQVKGGVNTMAEEQAYLLGPASDPGRCLDADLNTINRNGTKVQLWACDEYAAQQAWYIRQIPEGYYRFQNAYSGRYLDADLNTINRNGTVVQLWDYVAGAKNQWFAVNEIPEGYLRLQNVQSGRYLDADLNTSYRNGTVVQLWQYVAGAQNQWWF
ncbi:MULTISPECIES: RICIN domain-containing protein [Amycolatopsis]|uniref:Ricin B lectin domain-containing protein n=1 Tax=Amycolatopsis tucumanensis TaxID=401106 RepID=A0ABP7IBI0_9PSEU|nr:MULTISPECIES: RICIN domain-containing protein [Amycolatopsis]MCF6422553.1 RICIN domain-containing protein [Amycolatopsis tucumanensis]